MRILLCLSILAAPFFAQVHPLDSLTTSEFWTVYETLQKAGHGDADTVFSSILLHPPSKQAVLTNQPVPRQADVILRKGNKSYAALVNITAKSVVSHQELKDAQAPFTLSELLSAPSNAFPFPSPTAALPSKPPSALASPAAPKPMAPSTPGAAPSKASPSRSMS
jgi:primary-amine oxidase